MRHHVVQPYDEVVQNGRGTIDIGRGHLEPPDAVLLDQVLQLRQLTVESDHTGLKVVRFEALVDV